MFYFKGILIAILATTISAVPNCGKDYGICPSGQCCSKYGYCGTTSDHCSTGCQANYGICTNSTITTTNSDLCGKETGNKCANNLCCSKYGYCGDSDAHCSVSQGCQAGYGRCGDFVSNSKLQYYYKCKNPNHWALSFDDGPYKYDMELLNLLKKKGVKATFFLNGNNVLDITSKKGEAIVKRMYKDGHVIGSHTWKHSDLTLLSKEEIISEMTKLENVLQKYIGKKPAFMRPPYGSGANNAEIASILSDLGYTASCIWNVDTLDWDKVGDIDYSIKVFKSNLGNPIMSLNHCFYEGITEATLLALAEAEIDFMLSKGYTPVTMDVCLGLDAYQK
ncbi:glycoside hydrolase/deacetylase [Piromyces finnis]|uniref:Glycoside hydrolase/deacetylase n=1 Tax=Piromyces finnis TaxID=1754191 RepID=A0A1Y1VMZ4_9FUNG|nr:glycoside hydrolase/deacetylase [Piromyces finnis]|eukprot:ORX60785.1 glycoside hydrolase/deacetylase [Piromyces finnis]